MGDQPGSPAAAMERTQTMVELMLGAVIPSILSVMLFSYVIFRDLFDIMFVAVIIAAILMLWPAKRIYDLHYETWSRHTLPLKLLTGMIGMVYISAISVFSVSMISIYEGFTPEEPLTLAVMILLLFVLIGLLAYNSKRKEQFLASEKRHYRKDPRFIQVRVMDFISGKGKSYRSFPGDRRWRVEIEGEGLVVNVTPIAGGSEVMVESIAVDNMDLLNSLKNHLDS